MLGDVRLDVGRADAEARVVFLPDGLDAARVGERIFAVRLRLREDAVVHVGDVADEGHAVAAVAQVPHEHVVDAVRAHVAEVHRVLHGRPADVEARVARLGGLKDAALAGERVVEQ